VKTAPAQIVKTDETKTNAWYEVTLREGRNQQIRRMFDSIGHSVIKLRRVRIGPVTAEGILIGQWRHLTPAEVKRLKGESGAKGGGKKGQPAGGGPAATKGAASGGREPERGAAEPRGRRPPRAGSKSRAGGHGGRRG
jgi:23S rRNA pseudouridine2605 synthase